MRLYWDWSMGDNQRANLTRSTRGVGFVRLIFPESKEKTVDQNLLALNRGWRKTSRQLMATDGNRKSAVLDIFAIAIFDHNLVAIEIGKDDQLIIF